MRAQFTMPPTLDLSGSTHATHAKMAMAPPRINLRRATSYSHDKGPLSSTSSRFGFDYLLFASPPPSPGLPQLAPRPKKTTYAPRPRRVFRAVLFVAGVVVVFLVTLLGLRRLFLGTVAASGNGGVFTWPIHPLRIPPGARENVAAFELVANDGLPDFPTPVIVNDNYGRLKWTVSIPSNSKFPLTSEEYIDMCAKCREVAVHIDTLRQSGLGASAHGLGSSFHKAKNSILSHTPFGGPAHDGDFVDVHEAETAGILSGSVSISTLLSQQEEGSELLGEAKTDVLDLPVCQRSMTFVLASASEAGLGRTLMVLWIAYAAARREHRQFFLDDTRWAYGKYTDIFAPPPPADCRPPLRHEMVPCPWEARHLVVTVDTAREFLFPSEAADDTPRAAEARAARFFDLARHGYETLFRLKRADAAQVAGRIHQLRAMTEVDRVPTGADKKAAQGTIVGVHVRRGDRHPLEFQYQDSYIPLAVYADRANAVLEAQHPNSRNSRVEQLARSHSLTIVASDDPLVYRADELAGAVRAQEYIQLATVSQAQRDAQAGGTGVIHRYVDETFGWEGGFFSAMFWHLGHGSGFSSGAGGGSAISGAAVNQPLSVEAVHLRSTLGRSYMMDLAVLAGASDRIVCAASATGCRLLAVMLGHSAVDKGHWINVDGGYGWWAD